MIESKDTNPKDAIGSTKLDMGLIPDSALVELALAFTEGALKYGRFNWRIAGVRASIYHAAIQRHRAKWWNGEDQDSKTRIKHLASIMACCAILIDAEQAGLLTDDRPPLDAALTNQVDTAEAHVRFLKDLLKDFSPHQYTIADAPRN